MKEEKIVVKKVYSKPIVSKVQLVAEQAVLANCKWGTGSGVRAVCRAAGDLSCSSTPRS